MNEKIRELAEQAGHSSDSFDKYCETLHPLWNTHISRTYAEQFFYAGLNAQQDLEKFAELIVAECVKQVKPTQHHEVWAQSYLGGVDGLDLLYSKIKDIKKHFGVEE